MRPLELKLAHVFGFKGNIYSFRRGHLQGFQFSKPTATAPGFVVIYAFFGKNEHLQIWMSVDENSDNHLNQAEVNCVLRTLRPADEQPSRSP